MKRGHPGCANKFGGADQRHAERAEGVAKRRPLRNGGHRHFAQVSSDNAREDFCRPSGMTLHCCTLLTTDGGAVPQSDRIALCSATIIARVAPSEVAMTAVPQRTALSHAFGALCVTLVGTAEFICAPRMSRAS